MLAAGRSSAQVTVAEPQSPIQPVFPANAPAREVQVVLQLVVDKDGRVESAVAVSRAPEDAPQAVVDAAVEAAKAARFTPSTRDGRPIRSRIEYVIVVRPPARPQPEAAAASPSATAPQTITTNQQDEDYAQIVQVRGTTWSSPRGLGDVRVSRELLEAAPHQQTSEMLSAAPGFFVDHEDGEGLGNDVYLRGFDLEHGSGIEMRVGSIPINQPTHIQGQGYADANFIIPEVVRSVRVLEGPYDPRQGDAAIVGSAYFDLGVPERGYQAKTSYGSFNQWRVVGVAAPRDMDDETFAAFSLRQTDGFGQSRASRSASGMAQYGLDLGPRDHLRVLATAYGARSALAGVVRQDDVDAGRIDYYGTYGSPFAQNQSVESSRVVVGADFDHSSAAGTRFEIAPWFMWTDFRARQNYAGNLETSQTDPHVYGLGDLFETTNQEAATGCLSRVHSATVHLGPVDVVGEPGVYVRAGHTDQSRSLVNPSTLAVWDRRLSDGLQTTDVGAYVDLDVRVARKIRISGGPRADWLGVTVDDHLSPGPAGVGSGSVRHAAGIAAGPRVTAEYDAAEELAPVVSYGEGFRSLDAAHLSEGASAPYSKVRSVEGGFRSQVLKGRYVASASIFETWVGNELVFEPEAGGLETQGPSTRIGFVGSLLARPLDWLLASAALSVVRGTFETRTAGGNHYVPNVPPVLFRADVSARGTLFRIGDRSVVGRAGVGYTFMAGRYLTDAVVGPSASILNLRLGARYGWVELGLDVYNALGLRYPDDEEAYYSNWTTQSGGQRQPLASFARHIVAAPPRTVLGTVALYF
jgi:hypothetical protein